MMSLLYKYDSNIQIFCCKRAFISFLYNEMKLNDYRAARSELHRRGVLRILRNYVFLSLNENICCDPSLEPSR